MLSELLLKQINHHVLKNISALCICGNVSVGVYKLECQLRFHYENVYKNYEHLKYFVFL